MPQLDSSRDAPARLGRYELIGHLATGGMAEIHLARLAGEGGFEKSVVVKRLLPELVASPAYVAMFLDEGKLVARLDHPNICEVFDLGRDGAEYYLAMPFLDGVPVHDLIARPRDPDRASQLRVAAGVIAQACDGLHHAHELRDAELVHRDVSPSNLFVTASGVVKVLDFGIAKVRGGAATEVGMIKGKTQYMAPEQLLGEAIDRRCDVFALGIVAFELATHARLFKRASDYLTARAILEEAIPRADAVDPAVPAALADVIAKALEREPAKRYATAKELGEAVRAAIDVASSSEIAAAVTSTDELTAQRTRQLRVLEAARSKVSDVVTRPIARHADSARRSPDDVPSGDARRSDEHARRFVSPIDEAPTTITPRHRARVGWLIAIGGCVLAAIVVAVGWPRDEAVATLVEPPEVSPTKIVTRADIAENAREPAPRDTVGPAPTLEAIADPGRGSQRRPPPAYGAFSIDSTPFATIYFDNTRLGITPMLKRRVPSGRHRVKAVLSDGRAKELTIDVPQGGLAQPILLTW